MEGEARKWEGFKVFECALRGGLVYYIYLVCRFICVFHFGTKIPWRVRPDYILAIKIFTRYSYLSYHLISNLRDHDQFICLISCPLVIRWYVEWFWQR